MLASIKFLLSGIFLIVIYTHTIQGQDTTPTPAPSKTPASIDNGSTPQEQLIESPQNRINRRLIRSFNQNDLDVLVGNVQRPNGLFWFDEKIYAVCNGDWTMYEINASTGSTITFVYGIRDAHTLYAESTDSGFNLWIPDFDTNTLYLTDHRRLRLNPINTSLNGPWGIAPLDDENFLVTSLKGNSIFQVNREGDSSVFITDLQSPTGIVTTDTYGYVANNGSSRRSIEWFELDDPDPVVLVSGLQNTAGLAKGSDDYLYFTYALGTRGVVGRVDPEQCREETCTNEQVEIVVYTDLPAPLAGLTISPEMELFFHTIYRPELYRVRLYE